MSDAEKRQRRYKNKMACGLERERAGELAAAKWEYEQAQGLGRGDSEIRSATKAYERVAAKLRNTPPT